MTATNVSREQFFNLGGIATVDGAYTPVSIGKGNKVRDGNRAWINSLTKLDFTNATQLAGMSPETVTENNVIVPVERVDDLGNYYLDNDNIQKNYKAIVGSETKKVYSIKSNRYHAVQHRDILDAFVQASESTGIQVFGRMNVEGPVMHTQAYFADPDCHIDLSEHNKDPAMLGFDIYNSHDGTTGFGGKVIGVRYLCSNMMAFGKVLGNCHWKHSVEMKDVTTAFETIIKSYMDRVPTLQDRINHMQDEVLTISEAECALWGIRMTPTKIESITDYMPELAPEIIGKNGKVSLYDVYNASNAYVTYSNTGARTDSRMGDIDNIENLMIKNIDNLISEGAEKRDAYLEAQKNKVINLDNAVLVND